MNKKSRRYKSILSLATLQFDGHVTEYFRKNSEKLVAWYLLPRGGNIKNFVALYRNGRLIERKEFFSPRYLILAYAWYYLEFLYILIRYFPLGETFYFINFQPFFFFFRPVIRLFWRIEYVYWVGDYWPMNVLSIRFFRMLMHYYHDRSAYTLYLSDRINKVMNYGRIVRSPGRGTVMWGIKPPTDYRHKRSTQTITLCFIGVLTQWQGIDALLSIVAKNPNMRLTLIGTGHPSLTKKYRRFIEEHHVSDRVIFPNRFFYGKELARLVRDCDIGVALYDTNPNTVSYYADPAKIKQYAEFGLPIIMTDSADIAGYISKYKAGVIVDRDPRHITRAIRDIKQHYERYTGGVKKFNDFFSYEVYYSRMFRFLEQR